MYVCFYVCALSIDMEVKGCACRSIDDIRQELQEGKFGRQLVSNCAHSAGELLLREAPAIRLPWLSDTRKWPYFLELKV